MKAPERIVSLLASGTELTCALGLGERLVGRSHECDYPAWVERLPVVSRPTFDIRGTSREIDERVRGRLRDGLPLYSVDDQLLLELAPDVLITQTHCEVCAVSPGDLAHGTAASLARQPVVALYGGTTDEILRGFAAAAEVLGAADAGATLVSQLRERLEQTRQQVRGLPRPRVACVEWIEPVFAMGNWGPELVDVAGGQNLLGNPGQHSTTLSFDAVREADPEVLVVAPCGFNLARAWEEMPFLAAQPGFAELRAVRDGRVYVCDGNLYFNRSSPSLFETPRILAELLHPGQVEPRHEGSAWRRWLSH